MACANSRCVVLTRGVTKLWKSRKQAPVVRCQWFHRDFGYDPVFRLTRLGKSKEVQRESIEFTQKVNCAEGDAGGEIGAEEYPG